jgi:hypothetical protein
MVVMRLPIGGEVKIMKRLVMSVILAVSICTQAEAQDNSRLLERVESNRASVLPGFAVEHRISVDKAASGLIWVRGKDFVFVWVESYQTTETAREAFVNKTGQARLEGFKVNVPEERVDGLGYDNYWSEDVPSGKRGLHFYREKVSVLVTAPSAEMAESVARQIDSLLRAA